MIGKVWEIVGRLEVECEYGVEFPSSKGPQRPTSSYSKGPIVMNCTTQPPVRMRGTTHRMSQGPGNYEVSWTYHRAHVHLEVSWTLENPNCDTARIDVANLPA